MSGRIVSVYERSLTTTVNDIEHIESQSLAGYGVVKIFFQPNVNINTANAQVTAISQTVLKQMPAGITPPIILNFSASSVPILQLALSSRTLSEQRLAGPRAEYHPASARHRAWRRDPVPVRRQVAADADRPRPAGAALVRPRRAGCRLPP